MKTRKFQANNRKSQQKTDDIKKNQIETFKLKIQKPK